MQKGIERKYEMVWAYVDEPIKQAISTLAKAKGVSISEYVRSLILEDLDRRNFFKSTLSQDQKQTQKNDLKGQNQNPEDLLVKA
jgi:hypothetical protein